ncbi:MAG: hypothetical protein Q9167_000573 [Letrouitia subvulpina]
MNLVTSGLGSVNAPGVIPHTPSNVAGFTQRSMLTNGIAMISANYETSFISNFTLKSTYYGCTAAVGETLAGLPAACTITATSYNVNNKKVASQSFDYKTTGALSQQMNQVTFGSGFENVYYVTFNVTNSLLVAGQLDNVVTQLFEY